VKIGVAYAAYMSNDEHLKYAKETLESVKSAEHEIVFCGVLNFSAKTEYTDYLRSKGMLLENPENNVSMAWNKAIAYLLTM
jgi:hypothetical protein